MDFKNFVDSMLSQHLGLLVAEKCFEKLLNLCFVRVALLYTLDMH